MITTMTMTMITIMTITIHIKNRSYGRILKIRHPAQGHQQREP